MASYLLPTTGSSAWNENTTQRAWQHCRAGAVPGRGEALRQERGALTHAGHLSVPGKGASEGRREGGRAATRWLPVPCTPPRALLLSGYSASAHPNTPGAAVRARTHEISHYPPSGSTEAVPGGGRTFLLTVNS